MLACRASKARFESNRALPLIFPWLRSIISEAQPDSHLSTDAQLTECVRQCVWEHHACCTNKIGDLETDPMAVVNSRGQVEGMRDLRVADISIFPVIPSYFPVAPISIACERIADDIIHQARQTLSN